MDTHRKSFLIIILTLVLGYSAGWLSNGYFFQQRVERMRNMNTKEEAFAERIQKILEIDDQKMETIKPILQEHFKEMRENSRAFRQSMRENTEALKEDLSEHLTPEELERLKKNMRFLMNPRGRKPRNRPGPPRRPNEQ